MAIDLTAQILDLLSQNDDQILTSDAFPQIPSTEVKSALDRLKSREMVAYEAIDRDEAILTPEAEVVAANGSPEAKVFEAVRAAVGGLRISDLPVCRLSCRPARLVDVIQKIDCCHRNLLAKREQASGRAKL